MKYFCDKYGKECPNETPRAQSYNCDAWDPREFLADKTCRHALTAIIDFCGDGEEGDECTLT